MGRVVVSFSVSLDGCFEGPDHDLSWGMVDEELHQHMNDWIAPLSAFLHGRVIHELMADYWPTADQEPDCPKVIREFAAIWRDKPKHVYSRTLTSADWNATVVPSVEADEVRALKEQYPGDLGLGGAELAESFRRLGLVDEYRFYVTPVVLGKGRRLFTADQHDDLTLRETQVFGNGVVLLRYDVTPAA